MDAKMYFKVVLLFLICSISFYWFTSYNDNSNYLSTEGPDFSFSLKPAGSPRFWSLHNFTYILTPREKCSTEKSSEENLTPIRFIQLVTSYSGEVLARSALRRAYPSDELTRLGVWRVFLLARPKKSISEASQSALKDENRRFGDLLQGNFDESYRNLTYKHAMGLRWASKSCPTAEYIIKMDDDIVVDMYSAIEIINSMSNATFDIMGYVFDKMRPIRLKANKWYVSTVEYNRDVYPKFVSGWFYVTKPDVASKLVDNASELPYFWIDDVFITGIAAELMNARFLDIHKLFSTYPEILDCCIKHNVSCETIVAPSSGDFDLQIRFQRHSHKCKYSQSCTNLPPGQNISQVCVAKKIVPQLHRGLPSLTVLKL